MNSKIRGTRQSKLEVPRDWGGGGAKTRKATMRIAGCSVEGPNEDLQRTKQECQLPDSYFRS
jgi:hypothetical protein